MNDPFSDYRSVQCLPAGSIKRRDDPALIQTANRGWQFPRGEIRRGHTQRSAAWGRLIRGHAIRHQTEPHRVEAVVRIVARAEVDIREVARQKPRAALQDAVRRAAGIDAGRERKLIGAPLQHRAAHIERADRGFSHWVQAHRRDAAQPALAGIGVVGMPVGAPGVQRVGLTAGGCLLPLPFGGQAHLKAQPGAEPAAVRHRVIPGDFLRRVVVGLDRFTLVFGAAAQTVPPLRVGMTILGFEENAILSPRHGVAGNDEPPHWHRLRRVTDLHQPGGNRTPGDLGQTVRAQPHPGARIAVPRQPVADRCAAQMAGRRDGQQMQQMIAIQLDEAIPAQPWLVPAGFDGHGRAAQEGLAPGSLRGHGVESTSIAVDALCERTLHPRSPAVRHGGAPGLYAPGTPVGHRCY